MRLPFGFRLTREERSVESPAVPLGSLRAWEELWGAYATADAGVAVTTATALGVPAVWAAVNFLSSSIASLPLRLYARAGESAEPATGDQLYRLLHDAPNAELTSYRWRHTAMAGVLTAGRSYTFIERNRAGRVSALWPLDPAAVVVERQAGRTVYRAAATTVSGQTEAVYEAAEIIDIPFALKADGVEHWSPLVTLKNAIGLAIALERYGSRFFAGGGVPPLQLIGPFQSPGGAERAGFDVAAAIRQARARQSQVLPLPTGHELKAIGTDPDKSQMSEARRFQLEEIARIYGLPPVFLQDLSRGTFTNTEQQGLHFVKHTLGQWVQAWEQELNLKLFGSDRRRFVRFNLDGLLRGDFASRMSGYATAVQNAIRTPDEIRALEELPPRGGPAGKLHIQGATVELGKQGQSAAAPPPAAGDDREDEGGGEGEGPAVTNGDDQNAD